MTDQRDEDTSLTDAPEPAPVAAPVNTPGQDLLENLQGHPDHRLQDVVNVLKVLHPEITDADEIRNIVIDTIDSFLFG